jgi:hypothetical protein
MMPGSTCDVPVHLPYPPLSPTLILLLRCSGNWQQKQVPSFSAGLEQMVTQTKHSCDSCVAVLGWSRRHNEFLCPTSETAFAPVG